MWAVSECHFSNSSLLTVLIKKLFTLKHGEKVLMGVPDNNNIGLGKSFLNAFKEARV